MRKFFAIAVVLAATLVTTAWADTHSDEEFIERARLAAHEYFAAYNTEDVDKKRELLERSFSANGRFVSESFDYDFEGVMKMVSTAHEEYRLNIVGSVRVHNQYMTFDWEITDLDGVVLYTGVDFCELAPDGKLHEIVVFFDE